MDKIIEQLSGIRSTAQEAIRQLIDRVEAEVDAALEPMLAELEALEQAAGDEIDLVAYEAVERRMDAARLKIEARYDAEFRRHEKRVQDPYGSLLADRAAAAA